jgi:hypothetical protein
MSTPDPEAAFAALKTPSYIGIGGLSLHAGALVGRVIVAEHLNPGSAKKRRKET